LGFNSNINTNLLYRALKHIILRAVSMLQLKIEINEKVENVTCLEYITKKNETITINNFNL